ncbi:hypothetical protein OBBRIDRAFT_485172 [Obba rivulosa]|uniref:Secreted protein n=1 Tax=Obba rivulosa TaxID=1052685 RepID=A0A8E2AX86_9APHY|nr:hypothetical protein OBBRIDRAFT_485172 [Obba rivulosa]
MLVKPLNAHMTCYTMYTLLHLLLWSNALLVTSENIRLACARRRLQSPSTMSRFLSSVYLGAVSCPVLKISRSPPNGPCNLADCEVVELDVGTICRSTYLSHAVRTGGTRISMQIIPTVFALDETKSRILSARLVLM